MKQSTKGCCGCLVIFFVGIFLVFIGSYVYHEWIWEAWPPARIERITGIKVPKYKVIKMDEGERHFTGDYEDKFEIEFQTIPSDELFDKIDEMLASGNTKWQKEGETYKFSIIWGNGLPAPEGESENMDTFFSITITKGKKNGEITSGAW